MNGRRLQGLFLIIGGFCMIIGLFATQILLFYIIALIGTAMFILGIPAIHAVQPGGVQWICGDHPFGTVSLYCPCISIRLSKRLTLGNGLIFTSALAGLAGRLIVGWITNRKKIFPGWVGWAFIVEGFVNFIGGGFNLGSLAGVFYIVVVLLGAGALFGYGSSIFRRLRDNSSRLCAGNPPFMNKAARGREIR